MAGTAVTVSFKDLESGLDIGSDTGSTAFVTWELGKTDTVSYTIVGHLAFEVWSAANASGNVLATVSIGSKVVGKKILVHAPYDISPPGTLIDNGPSYLDALNGTPIDRITAYNTTVQDVLDQIAGIPIGIPGVFTPPEYAYSFVVGSDASSLEVSEDIDEISILKVIDLLSRDIGAQLGVDRGQFWTDSAAGTITIGQVGDTDFLVFGDGMGAFEILRHTPLEVNWDGTNSRVKIKGGSSTHGLPDQPTVTGIVGLLGAGGVDDATFVLAIYAGSTIGGVYFLTPDGIFHPLSQNMGVTSLCVDPKRHLHYAGTDRGVYEEWASAGVSLWKQTGGYAGKVKRVFVDTTSMGTDRLGNSTPGAQVYVVSDDPTPGLSGLITYPAINADVRLGIGIDYWKMLIGGDVIAASAVSDIVYYVLSSDPTKIRRVENLRSTTLARTTTTIAPQPGYAITDMIRVETGTYVLTTGGSDGFYFIAGSGSTVVKDGQGLPGLQIANVFIGIDGVTYACTDNGLYKKQTTWVPVSPVGGLFGVSVQHAAVGVPPSGQVQNILVPVGTPPPAVSTTRPMLAADGSKVHLSNTYGKFWDSILDMPVDAANYLRTNGLETTDPDFVWVKDVDGHNLPIYTLVKTAKPWSPGGTCTYAEVNEITADVNTSVERASQAVGIIALRYARHVSTPLGGAQEIESHFEDDSSLLMDLRPGYQVRLFYSDDACGDYPATLVMESYKVIAHTVAADENGGHSKTTLAVSCAIKRYTADELGSDILYTMSKLSKGR